MNITTKLAQFAAKYFNLTNDDKVYGIKNGDFFEVPSGSSSSWPGDDVTVANLCDKAVNLKTLVNDFSPVFYKPGVGAAQLFSYGATNGDAPMQYGSTAHLRLNSGSGSGGFYGADTITIYPGSTATGYTNLSLHFRSAGNAVSGRPYHVVRSWITAPETHIAADVGVYFSALSTATVRYAAVISLAGQGPSGNSAISANTPGVMVTYSDNANSGNFQIQYRNTSGTLSVVNTSIPPSITADAPTRLKVQVDYVAAGSKTVTVSIDATDYTLADAAATAELVHIHPSIGLRIMNSAGTSSINMYAVQPVIAWAGEH